jgi:CheY-like chemotaxis protein
MNIPAGPYSWKPPVTEGPEKTLLVAEDDRAVQSLYRMGLKGLSGFRIVLVENGLKAVEVLRSQTVDVLVTDLNMPVMDGFELIAKVASDYPALPIIVMTGLGEAEHQNRPLDLGALRIMSKPPRLSHLMDEIRAAASQEPTGLVRGITLGSLLQLLNWERKSCTLTVKHGEDRGVLYCKDGELIHALHKDKEGIPAAYDILGWEKPEIEFVDVCRVKGTIKDLPITEILMNVAMIQDHTPLQAEPKSDQDATQRLPRQA